MAGPFCALLNLAACTGVNSSSSFADSNLANTSVAMIFIFGAFYKMAGTIVDPFLTEIAPYGLRDKTFFIKQSCDAFANLFSGFVSWLVSASYLLDSAKLLPQVNPIGLAAT